MIRLDIFSDPVCPWCHIGKALLDRALERRPGHPFTVEWHPFQLNPDMPPEGMDRRAYLEARFGSRIKAAEAHVAVAEAAEAAGLQLDLGAITRMPNTLDAHRLIHWAGLEGAQSRVVSALFRAYFREGRDIGATETLGQIAAGAGMDQAVVTRLLASDADRETVLAREAHARERGVRAVPTFIIANAHVLPGAQPVALWEQVIDELVTQLGTDMR
ncbi:DsbA family oxidoreductase [Plastorhodobacter daqingensis]|uniref:DsbA family oxidoreductase n=1 Tax=Plastorhodobacter daqingensis TaxID=1387281 RepID=A0ABW2UNT1_9RHOB